MFIKQLVRGDIREPYGRYGGDIVDEQLEHTACSSSSWRASWHRVRVMGLGLGLGLGLLG